MIYNYNKLTPFKKYIIQNFPYIDADFDGLTNYQLYAQVVDYLNKVIDEMNGANEQVEILTNAFNNLHDYVENYFANLDVQEEINNKLDEMATTGVLQSLISDYFANVNNQIININNKVDRAVSGSPAGVYASVSALTSADPNHDKIYVVTEDGNWYYYNTSSSTWTSGGTYQASINTPDVEQLEYNMNKLLNDISITDVIGVRIYNYSVKTGDVVKVTTNCQCNIHTHSNTVVDTEHDVQSLGSYSSSGGTRYFTITGDANYLRISFEANGTITIENLSKRVPILENDVDELSDELSSFETKVQYATGDLLTQYIDRNDVVTGKFYNSPTDIRENSGYSIVEIDNLKAGTYYVNSISPSFSHIKNIATGVITKANAMGISGGQWGNYTLTIPYDFNLYLTVNLSATNVHLPNLMLSDGTIPSEYVYGTYTNDDGIFVEKNSALLSKKYVVAKDGSGDFTKIKDAIEEATKRYGSIVYVKQGTYDLIDEYTEEYLNNLSASNNDYGLVLENGINLIFAPSAFVKFNYTGSNTFINTDFSPFNTGSNYGFTIDGLNLVASNCRYCVHDDPRGDDKKLLSKNTYKNCYFELDNRNNTAWGVHQIIGGGLSDATIIEIENCIFKNYPASAGTSVNTVSYHNSTSGSTAYQSMITIKDNYFSDDNYITISGHGSDTTHKTKAIITNNNLETSSDIVIDATVNNVIGYVWNNNFRN